LANVIGIDPDFRIHVSERLLEIHDGPFLELGLKGIVGQVIYSPRRGEDRPEASRPPGEPVREPLPAAEATCTATGDCRQELTRWAEL
jgi:hypothetical protein